MIHKRKQSHRLRKESRHIPVNPRKTLNIDQDETGIYVRCWNCGWLCDTRRDSLGDAQSRDGVEPLDFTSTPFSGQAVLGGDVEHFHVAAELDANGDPKDPERHFKPNHFGGCPLCGCKNYRGDY